MPGAALTGVLDDKTYEGTVAVKLGPLRMSYKGKVTVEEVDEANHSARLTASGRDTKGAGTAKANVETRLEPAGDTRTRLKVTSDVQLTGKVASFGRGGAINDVATRLFGQFADCLRATLEAAPAAPDAAASAAVADAVGAGAAEPAGTGAAESVGAGAAEPVGAGAAEPVGAGAAEPVGAGASPATGATPGPPSEPVAAGDGATTAGAGAGAAAEAGVGTGSGTDSETPPAATVTPGAAPVSPVPPPRAPEALDAGSLVGTIIKGRLQALVQAIAGFFRRLFGRRRSDG
jgi:carbon monoxide dehydrogenase subunit G